MVRSSEVLIKLNNEALSVKGFSHCSLHHNEMPTGVDHFNGSGDAGGDMNLHHNEMPTGVEYRKIIILYCEDVALHHNEMLIGVASTESFLFLYPTTLATCN